MNLVLTAPLLDSILAHARDCYPAEGCGLVIGARFVPMRNAAAETGSEYEMDPAELIGVLRDARNRSEELVAIYHSHPKGPAKPSKRDIARANYPEAAHLIVSLSELERPQAAAFRIVDGEALDVELHVIV